MRCCRRMSTLASEGWESLFEMKNVLSHPDRLSAFPHRALDSLMRPVKQVGVPEMRLEELRTMSLAGTSLVLHTDKQS